MSITISRPTNVEFSRSLPANVPFVTKYTGFSRIKAIAFEALPLVAMVSPQFAYAGNFAGLTINSITDLRAGRKTVAVVGAAFAAGFYAKPLETSQLMHSISAIKNAASALKQLYNKHFIEAGKSILKSGSSVAFVGALATGNPQMVAISLVAQTAFSLHRAYQFHQKGREYETMINAAIAGFNGFTAYNLRSDLLVPSEKYEAAFVELKNWAFEKQSQVVNAVSQFSITKAKEWAAVQVSSCKTTLEGLKVEDMKSWALDNVNKFAALLKASLNDLFQTIDLNDDQELVDLFDADIGTINQEIVRSEKIKKALQEKDFSVEEDYYDETWTVVHLFLVYAKLVTTSKKFEILEDNWNQILENLQSHISFE